MGVSVKEGGPDMQSRPAGVGEHEGILKRTQSCPGRPRNTMQGCYGGPDTWPRTGPYIDHPIMDCYKPYPAL